MVTLSELLTRVKNIENNLANLAKRNYGERAEKALSDCKRIETKEDIAIDELDASLADTTYLVCELMKGE